MGGEREQKRGRDGGREEGGEGGRERKREDADEGRELRGWTTELAGREGGKEGRNERREGREGGREEEEEGSIPYDLLTCIESHWPCTSLQKPLDPAHR